MKCVVEDLKDEILAVLSKLKFWAEIFMASYIKCLGFCSCRISFDSDVSNFHILSENANTRKA